MTPQNNSIVKSSKRTARILDSFNAAMINDNAPDGFATGLAGYGGVIVRPDLYSGQLGIEVQTDDKLVFFLKNDQVNYFITMLLAAQEFIKQQEHQE